MKQLRTKGILSAKRKIPLQTVVLPPLSPERSTEMLSQVLVNKSNGELVAISRPSEPTKAMDVKGTSDMSRVAQLEQNIRFLQEQHQLMLTGLHKEVDILKQKNRELQFQLVFMKGSVPTSPSSSSEDDTKHKTFSSPSAANITPLQVELLEKELGELKLQMQEIKNRNTYLSNTVDEQKKKLETYEIDLTMTRDQVAPRESDLLRKLDEAETLIHRLHQENSELRRDYTSSQNHHQQQQQFRDPYSHQQQQQRGKGGQRYRSGNNGGYKGNNWFPPLHSQSYWQQQERGGASGGSAGDGLLPNLSGSGGGGGSGGGRRSSNNNHYRNGDGRKYNRGQQQQQQQGKGQKPL